MLLGPERARGLLHDVMGYTDVAIPDTAFERDTRWDEALAFTERLGERAEALGLGFGVKFTNTLIVENRRDFFPADQKEMYLSGPPLHVLAMTLLDRLSSALPGVLDVPGHDGDVMVSFSAGITKDNLADSLAAGVQPTTVCSDLLKPGGYGRLAPMLRSLTSTLRDEEAADLPAFKAARQAAAVEAGHATTAEAHVGHVRGDGIGAYHLTGNEKLPRQVDHELEMFGCVACNFCITVCPNDAFFSIASLADGCTEHSRLAGKRRHDT